MFGRIGGANTHTGYEPYRQAKNFISQERDANTLFFPHALQRFQFPCSFNNQEIRGQILKTNQEKKKKKENFYKLKIYISVDPGKLDPYFKNSNSDKTPV